MIKYSSLWFMHGHICWSVTCYKRDSVGLVINIKFFCHKNVSWFYCCQYFINHETKSVEYFTSAVWWMTIVGYCCYNVEVNELYDHPPCWWPLGRRSIDTFLKQLYGQCFSIRITYVVYGLQTYDECLFIICRRNVGFVFSLDTLWDLNVCF